MERHRYQIYLDPEQYETLRRLAFERRASIADLLREAIGAYLMTAGIQQSPKKKATGRPARTGQARLSKPRR